jgi:hypothetical protein
MIIYSKILNLHSDLFLIKHLRKNKWIWDYKFFFDHLTIRNILVLIKSLCIRSNKVVFVHFEAVSNHLQYRRPDSLADIIFGYSNGKNTIYWNLFLDEAAKNNNFESSFKNKKTSDLIQKVCFVSSNTDKIQNIKKNYPDLYMEMDIYGNFHMPINGDENIHPIKNNKMWSRSYNSLFTTSRYIASLGIYNNLEEGYVQESIFWSLRALTPPILKIHKYFKNFTRPEFYIDFDDYINMSQQERLTAIKKIQERLDLGEDYLTNLTRDYIEFFKKSFSENNEPDLKKIILESKSFRSKFIKL